MLTSCAGGIRPKASGDLTLTTDAELPAPAMTDQSSMTRPYQVGPGDKLRIDVYALDDLSREVTVDSSGWISFPISGALEVNGMSPRQIAAAIGARLSAGFVRDPQVSVNLVDVASQMVTVDGEVKDPGLYPVGTHTSLMRVIAAAKGTTEFSNPRNVVIVRTIGTKRYAGVYNLVSIRSGKYPDPQIYSNDVVLVGDSSAKKVLHDFIQLSPAVLTPLVLLLN